MWYLEQPSDETLYWFKDQFLDKIFNSINNAKINRSVKNVLIKNGTKEVIEKLLIEPADKLYTLNEQLEKELNSHNVWNNKYRQKILKLFNYEYNISKNTNIAYELSRRIGRKTCVYCNRIYTFTVEDSKRKAVVRPDFDHWLPKGKHPLLSMSLYNLIPSCPICNRCIKLNNEFKLSEHIHPYMSNKETSFKFQYSPLPNSEYDVKMVGCTKEEYNTAKILRTEELYKCHGNMEVKDLVEFVYKNSPIYLNELYLHVMQAYGKEITAKEAYKIIMGTDSEPEKFLDRPLAKLKRDILIQLKNIKNLDIDFDF